LEPGQEIGIEFCVCIAWTFQDCGSREKKIKVGNWIISKKAAIAGLLEGQRVAQCHRLAEDSKSPTAHAEKGPGSFERCPLSDQLP
jgi:hypothetical protein